jgi:hypothetical protein
MKKILLNIVFSLMLLAGFSQQQQPKQALSNEGTALEEYWAQWKKDLYDVGIKLTKDSMQISEESKRVMQDSNYRKLIFPESYTWAKAVAYLKQTEMKKAFWYFIKLYAQDTANRKLIVESLVPFDRALEMDKVLISTFYTYALLDPAICTFKNNRIQITHPDVLEKEFSQVKEMVGFITASRKSKTDSTKSILNN